MGAVLMVNSILSLGQRQTPHHRRSAVLSMNHDSHTTNPTRLRHFALHLHHAPPAAYLGFAPSIDGLLETKNHQKRRARHATRDAIIIIPAREGGCPSRANTTARPPRSLLPRTYRQHVLFNDASTS